MTVLRPISTPRARARGWFLRGVALVAALGPGGCFHDNFVPMEDGDGPMGSTTGEGVSTTSESPGTTAGPDEDGTGHPASSSGGSESSGSSGALEGSSGSDTGVMQDDGSGEVVLGVDELMPGDLVITEVMWNPTCSADNCEWIEVLNATESAVDLVDLFVQDSDQSAGNQGRITSNLIVAPGGLAVLTRGLRFWNYDFAPDGVYGPQPGFNNGEPERALLLNANGILDEIPVFPIDQDSGVSSSLSGTSLDAISNDEPGVWCAGTTPLPTFTSTEYGTPGQTNPPC